MAGEVIDRILTDPMFLNQPEQRQHPRRRQHALSTHPRAVHRRLDRFQQPRHAKMFALGQDLQSFKMQIPQEKRTCLEQLSAQSNHLMLRLADMTHCLRQQTTDLLCQHSADRALLAEQISQELSEFHANLTTVVAALRHMSQRQIPPFKPDTQAVLHNCQPEQIQQLLQDLADYIALSQAEVKNQLIELSLIRHARSRQVQQRLQSTPDRRLVDMADLLTDLQSFCTDPHWVVSEHPEASLTAIDVTPIDPPRSDSEMQQT